jgi:hypothetical protein
MPRETDSKPSDRRAEPRLPATGPVALRPKGFAPGNTSGQMMDINGSGFRARHSFQTLGSGNIVDFAYGSLQGQARVVWTRILGDQVESGFLILSRVQG